MASLNWPEAMAEGNLYKSNQRNVGGADGGIARFRLVHTGNGHVFFHVIGPGAKSYIIRKSVPFL